MNENLKQVYQNSVLPIFAHTPTEREKVEALGSGLYAKYKDILMIITDAHVIKDSRLKNGIVIPNNITKELEIAPTKSFYTSEKQEVDLGFYVLSEPLCGFTPYELIKPLRTFPGNQIRFIGYPSSKSKCKYSDVKGTPYSIDGILEDNTGYKISIKYDEKNIYIDGSKINPPDLHGMSGGPVFIYNDTDIELIGFTESVDLMNKKLYATKAEYIFLLFEKAGL